MDDAWGRRLARESGVPVVSISSGGDSGVDAAATWQIQAKAADVASVEAAGCCLRSATALLAARALKPLLYQVSPRDPLVIGVAVLVLGACAALASALPARRAMAIDPSSALREE